MLLARQDGLRKPSSQEAFISHVFKSVLEYISVTSTSAMCCLAFLLHTLTGFLFCFLLVLFHIENPTASFILNL